LKKKKNEVGVRKGEYRNGREGVEGPKKKARERSKKKNQTLHYRGSKGNFHLERGTGRGKEPPKKKKDRRAQHAGKKFW